jgi:aminomethyltransferase
MFLVPNAANTAEVVRRLAAEAPAGIEVTDLHEEYAVLAVQGPRGDDLLGAVGLPAGHAYMSFVAAQWRGTTLTVARTGYTGERGYELVIPADAAGTVWDALAEAGPAYDLMPCGIGARDTLRTEMGYPLHGQDISLDVTPVQARLGWAVGWKKPAFWGRSVLSEERAAGPTRRLRGIEARGRGIPRPGMSVVDERGEPLGAVTSGTFSPTRRVGVGLALLAAGVAEGEEVAVDVRGRREPFVVRRPPFVDASPTT